MKKTISISIANTLFYIDEDAYQELDAYLSSVRAHFASNPDKDEILKDIEGRIAERFAESAAKTNSKTVTLADVRELKNAMGTVEQFDESEGSKTQEEGPAGTTTPRRLYRDIDNAMIAGVSAGLGWYFGISPMIFRAIFIASIFFGGTGAIAYIILWILVPEAKTASQKLAMRGNQATLSTISQFVGEKAERTPIVRNLAQGVSRFFAKVVAPVVRVIVGLVMSAIGFCGIVAATVFAGIAIVRMPSFFEPSIGGLMSSPTFFLGLFGAYLALVVPLAFIWLCGSALIRRRNFITGMTILTLLGAWFLALVISGITIPHIVFRANEIMMTDPSFARETRELSVGTFGKIRLEDGVSADIEEGAKQEVSIEGQRRSIENMDISVKDGVLVIGKKDAGALCLFCFMSPTHVSIVVPTVSEMVLENSSRIEGAVRADSLSLSLRNSSGAELSVTAGELSAKAENASSLELRGTADTATVELLNASRYHAETLETASSTVSAQNASAAYLSVSTFLSATAENGSTIRYTGAPEVKKHIVNGSRLVQLDTATSTDEEYGDY